MRVLLGLLFVTVAPFTAQADFIGNYSKWKALRAGKDRLRDGPLGRSCGRHIE